MSEPASDSKSVLLDPLETSVGQGPSGNLRQHLIRHSSDEIEAVRHTYFLLAGSKACRQVDALDSCKKQAWFVRNKDTGLVKVVSKSCKLRWCPMCSNARKYHLSGQVMEWLEGVDKPKFLTMTIKHSNSPLEDQIDHLYKCFRKFRLIKEHKKLIDGGVWFFQIKKSKSDNLWHPHLHCVIDSAWLPGDKLWRTWLKITGTSKVIDITSVKDTGKVAEYVARYAARPSDLVGLETDERLEMVSALHGRRLVGTWGNARTISLSPSRPPDADDWVRVGDWWTVAYLFEIDENAKKIWQAFKLNKPLDAEFNVLGIEKAWRGIDEIDVAVKDQSWQNFFEFS